MSGRLSLSEEISCIQTIETHSSDVTSCDFGNNGILATGSGDKTVRVWLWGEAEGQYVEAPSSPLTGHKYGVTHVAFSPHGTMLATSSVDGSTSVWNIATGSRVCSLPHPGGGAVRVACFSPDCTLLASAGDDGQLALWDLVRRSLVRCREVSEGAIHLLACTPDGRLVVTGCSQGALKVWALEQEQEQDQEQNGREGSREESQGPLVAVDEAHDLGVLAGDMAPTQTLQELDEDDAVCFSGDCCSDVFLVHVYLVASGGNDHQVRVWEIRSPAAAGCGGIAARVQQRATLAGHGSAVTGVRFGHGGRLLASTSLDKTVRLWLAEEGSCWSWSWSCAHVLSGHGRFVACAAFSRCGSLLASGSNDRTLRVWALSGERRPTPGALPVHSNHNYLHAHEAVGEGALVKHAEVEGESPSLLQRILVANGAVNGVAFGDRGRLLAAAGGDKTVRVWSRSEREQRFGASPSLVLECHRYSVQAVEFAPRRDGAATALASCGLDGEALLWDAQTGDRTGTPFQCAGGGALRCLRFSPDGHLLITAGDDERVSVWSVVTGELLMSAEGHSDAVSALAVSGDSELLASCSADESIRLWGLCGLSDASPCLHVVEVAHDMGASALDFSPAEGMPGQNRNQQRRGVTAEVTEAQEEEEEVQDEESEGVTRVYVLASGGADGVVRLWRVPAGWSGEPPRMRVVAVRRWRSLVGHVGPVVAVRFSPGAGSLVASASFDRTARLWHAYTGQCLHVLEGHETLLTSVAFSPDCSLLATGSLDKTVLVWELPVHLVFQSTGPDHLKSQCKKVVEWSPTDVAGWLREWGLKSVAAHAQKSRLDGSKLLTAPMAEVLANLKIGEDEEEEPNTPEEEEDLKGRVTQLVRWLRHSEMAGTGMRDEEAPEEFLCPITQELMRDPVIASDGFTYERAALTEWLLGGRFSSPMTNGALSSTRLSPDTRLRERILAWLYGEAAEEAIDDAIGQAPLRS